MTDLESRMHEERLAILERLDEQLHQSSDPLQLALTDSGSMMDDIRNASLVNDTNIFLVGAEQARLSQLDNALRRIAEGNYGICTCCAGSIDHKRLSADPAVELCLDCQVAKERALPRVHLKL